MYSFSISGSRRNTSARTRVTSGHPWKRGSNGAKTTARSDWGQNTSDWLCQDSCRASDKSTWIFFLPKGNLDQQEGTSIYWHCFNEERPDTNRATLNIWPSPRGTTLLIFLSFIFRCGILSARRWCSIIYPIKFRAQWLVLYWSLFLFFLEPNYFGFYKKIIRSRLNYRLDSNLSPS
jgi:hypothetical protein